MTNYLADEIRQINDWQDIPDDLRQYVTRLADRADALTDQPVEVDADFGGLTPEQEIWARAVDSACRLRYAAPDAERVIGIAAQFVSAIRDGSRPA